MSNLIDNRQIRVFISSTFRDMQDERDYLMKRAFPKLRKLAAERDVTLTELDLRWGITEEEAESGKVVEICLREIENSIPFFIGIIGNRYGWIPEKKDLNDNVTERFKAVNDYVEHHLSVTEMEMQFGVLQREEDLHAYFFIKEQVEEQDNPEMLQRLKEEVKASKYPSSTYSSPEDLALQVEQAFTDLLNELFPEGELSELEKERIGQRAFMNQLCQHYIRNEHYFGVLDDWLNDWSQRHLVITGESGLGKSALIANWVKEKLQDENRNYNIVYHFTGNGGSEANHHRIVKTLVDEIMNLYGVVLDETNGKKEDKDMLDELFQKVASRQIPLLIIIDAINQIVDTDNAKLLNWLPYPPRNIKILFSTLDNDKTKEVFVQRNYPSFTLKSLDVGKRTLLVTEYLNAFSKKLLPAQIERIVRNKQCENTLVLKTLLEELINFGVFEKLGERIDFFLTTDSIEGFYQTLLQSYEDDYKVYGDNIIRHLLSLIEVSRNGLSEDELLTLTHIKPLYWSQFYCAFSTHFTIKNGLITFSHRYISEAVSNRYFSIHNAENSFRNELISFMQGKDTHRAWCELPYQYYHNGAFESLFFYLQNIKVFSFLYLHHKEELVSYWKKLIEQGYDYHVYTNIIQQEDEKETYIYIIHFFRDYFSLFDFVLSIAEDYIAWSLSHHGEEDGETAEAYQEKGVIFQLMGNYKASMDYYTKGIEVQEKVLGTNHPETATSYNNLGLLCSYMGNYDQALEYLNKSIEVKEFVLGINHPETATSYNNLGILYYYKGDYKRALEYFQKSFEIRKSVLGTKHSDIAQSYNNIGLLYSNMGDYERALEYHLKSLEINKSVLGNNHPYTAGSYNNIGLLYREMGNLNQAMEYFKKSIEVKELVLGTNHPDTATSYNNIGLLYNDMGDYERALEYYCKSLKIREAVLGTNHPDTATSYSNIGLIYKYMGDYNRALEYYQKALEIRESVLGINHPDMIQSYNNIGSLYRDMADFERALEYFFKSLEICESVLGTNHTDTAILYDNIGVLYSYTGDYTHALEYNQKSLEICEAVLGPNHLKTATSYNNIGLLYQYMGDYERALEYFQKSLEIYESVFGSNHPDTATSYNNLGSLYQDMGDYVRALEYYQKALGIRESVLGSNHPDTVTSYDNLGSLYQDMDDYVRALEYCLRSLEIRKSVLGSNHPDIATSYSDIGLLYKKMKDYERALEFYRKSLEIRLSTKDTNNSNVADIAFCYKQMGIIYRLMKDYEQSLDYCEKALPYYIQAFGEQHKEVAFCHKSIANALKCLRRYDEALEHYQKALEIQLTVCPDDDKDIPQTRGQIQEVEELNK